MIKIELSENDAIYLMIATVIALIGSGFLAAVLVYFVVRDLDEIPEGEEPYFTFTNRDKV